SISPCNNFELTFSLVDVKGTVIGGFARLEWDPTQVEPVLDEHGMPKIKYNPDIEGEGKLTGMDLEKGWIEGEASGMNVDKDTWIVVVVFHCIREGRSTIKIVGQLQVANGGTQPVLISDSTTVIQRVPAAVGGVVMSTNKLSVLAPYLALLGSAGALSFVYVLVRRRRA
ncbi:MAG: hypothetical protein QXE79_08595, partial [Candidatus Bathyarchaeia archaeon]